MISLKSYSWYFLFKDTLLIIKYAFEVIFISKYENSSHFIHKINYEILDEVINFKKLGFIDNNDQFYNEINPDDFIIFAIDINEKLHLFAYTKLDDVLFDDKDLYNVYKSDKKLKFSKLKFFKKPIINNVFLINDDFNYLKISKDEYESIIPSKDKLDKKIPLIVKYHPNLTKLEYVHNTNNFIQNKFKYAMPNQTSSEIDLISNNLNFDEDSRFFIQHLDFKDLNILAEKMYLNEVENKSEEIKQVTPNDYILLYTTINSKNYFFAIGKVAYNLFNSFDNFKYFKPENTIKFRNIDYFNNVDQIHDFDELQINFNPKDQYVEVGEEDINLICENMEFSCSFPTYFDTYDLGDVRKFIVTTGKNLFDLIKDNCDVELFPIKKFLRLFCDLLNYYYFDISYEEVEEFFSNYALKFGFRLTSTREPDLIVTLNIKGGKKEVTYIMMNNR